MLLFKYCWFRNKYYFLLNKNLKTSLDYKKSKKQISAMITNVLLYSYLRGLWAFNYWRPSTYIEMTGKLAGVYLWDCLFMPISAYICLRNVIKNVFLIINCFCLFDINIRERHTKNVNSQKLAGEYKRGLKEKAGKKITTWQADDSLFHIK